jgi:regulator of sigma E protease
VVDVVTDPDTQVSLTEARRYDASLQIGDTMRQAAIGVTIGTSNLRIVERSYPVTQAIPMAFTQIKDVLVLTKDGIGQWVGGGDNPGFTGPIGIAQATGEVARAAGVPGVLQLTALLSISLAVINILPIPPFDGGRLAFVILEFVRGGKRIPPQKEVLVHLVGLVVVVGLVVLISGFDVMRLISGESVIR